MASAASGTAGGGGGAGVGGPDGNASFAAPSPAAVANGDAGGAASARTVQPGHTPPAVDPRNASEVARLCRLLYDATDPPGRLEAERALLALQAAPDALAKLRQMFEVNTRDAYVQLFVFSALSSFLTSRWTHLRDDDKANVRAFVYDELLSECGGGSGGAGGRTGANTSDFGEWPLTVGEDNIGAATSGRRKYSSVVLQQLVLLAVRICKLGWLEDDAYRALVRELLQACRRRADAGACSAYDAGADNGGGLDSGVRGDDDTRAPSDVALAALTRAVEEINRPLEGRTATQHRKTAVSFRDEALHSIFCFATESLTERVRLAPPPREGGPGDVCSALVRLSLACLTFDFIGTAPDDASEDLATIQVPQSWRAAIEDTSIVSTFLGVFAAAPRGYGTHALECVMHMASVRRSLFSSDAARRRYLHEHVAGMMYVLRDEIGLDRHENYHHTCRWLARLKCNYQLAELVVIDVYKQWIDLVAAFTVHSFSAWQWAPSSIFYLLVLWGRLVASMPYLRGEKLSFLDTYVERVAQAYVTSRLNELETRIGHLLSRAEGASVSAESVDDALDIDIDEGIEEHGESLPAIFRLQYDKTSAFLVGVLDARIERYANAVQSVAAGGGSSDAAPAPHAGGEIAYLEAELTWLVQVCAAVVGGRVGTSSSESQEANDGEVTARVLHLVRIVDARLAAHGAPRGRYTSKLDIALLDFMHGFRRVYIGDHAVAVSCVYTPLNERMKLSDHRAVLEVIVAKILGNLRLWTDNEYVLSRSLNLLLDLAQGYSSSRLLLKLVAVQGLLHGRVDDSMLFMSNARNGRLRTLLYHTIAKLMFQSAPEELFDDFVAPVTARMRDLAAALNDGRHAEQRVREAAAGVCRDLRGIVAATASRRTYLLVFDWLFPAWTPLVRKLVDTYGARPDVSVPLLKFWSDFVHNKSQRLVFDSSSANGILLFRETSALIASLGAHLVRVQDARQDARRSGGGGGGDVYTTFYKPVWLLYQVMTRSLTGGYVNFGVFSLYGDPALDNALATLCSLLLRVPQDDLVAYPKLLRAYFAFAEALCGQHVGAVVDMDERAFVYLLQSLCCGVQSLEIGVSSQCAAALDNIATFYYRRTVRGDGASSKMRQRLEAHPALLANALGAIFDLLLNEDCANQWSLSRPLLGLIVVNGDAFVQRKARMMGGETRADQRDAVAEAFDTLMRGVQPNVDPKNRDRFTQNVTAFRHTLRAHSLLR